MSWELALDPEALARAVARRRRQAVEDDPEADTPCGAPDSAPEAGGREGDPGSGEG